MRPSMAAKMLVEAGIGLVGEFAQMVEGYSGRW